jgi:hypothetical protein
MMTYVRVDDLFHEHEKVLDIGPLAEALWFRCLTYCARNRTDGRVPLGFVRKMGDMDGTALAAVLVDAGLLEPDDRGYRMHDYLEWQRSRDEIEALSEKRAAAGSKGGKQRASNLLGRSLANAKQIGSKPLADTDTDTEAKTEDGAIAPSEGGGAEAPPADPPEEPAIRSVPKPVSSTTELPKGWQPSDADIAWATAEKNWPRDWVDEQTESFVYHWRANPKRKADWSMTWRTWLKNEVTRYGNRPRGSPNGRPEPSPGKVIDSARYQGDGYLKVRGG